MTGIVSHLKGRAAEDTVERHYVARGAQVLHRRWRGTYGEIDLIFKSDDAVVFVEVKTARTLARAFESLGARQIKRLCASAANFLDTMPAGSLTPMRFDVAAMDGAGQIEVVENAFAA